MSDSYWTRTLTNRISRRRAIAATGGATLGAALLAACGSSNSSGGSGSSGSNGASDKSSLVTQPVDSTKEAKRGGILKDRLNADAPTMDVQQPIAPLNTPARHVYSTLIRQKAGHLAPNTTDLTGDLAESWEQSPDGLTITMKLRNTKWHNKAPVNNRAFDSSDVIASWNRYSMTGPLRGLVANSANPTAPVLSMTATDPRTIVVKLKEPLVYALALLASYGSFTGNMVIVPKEIDGGGFDIRRDMIGTGPYYLSDYTPSVSFTLKRHPDYWDTVANFPDQINYPIVVDNAQFEAQLRAGNIHLAYANVRAANVFQLKKDEPRLNLYQQDMTVAVTVMTFGQLPDGKTPLQDERVRQAFSMSWDRDAWIDAFYNVSNFQKDGLSVDTRWNSALPCDFPDMWLDPKGKDFGPNAKYYQHNLDEAKKLMSAAGFSGGLSVKSNRITTNAIGDLYLHAQALEGMSQDAGFKIQIVPVDYGTDYIPKIRDANGQYEGIAFHSVTGTTPWRLHPISALAAEYWSKAGATFKGFSTDGKNDKSGDPAVDALIEKARVEKDVNKQKGYAQDLQRMLAKSLYGLIAPGTASTFSLTWPAVRNMQNYRVPPGPAAMTHYSIWLDDTKAPFTNA